MKNDTGGTDMWCSKCQKITSCKAVSPKEVNSNLPSSRRFYKSKHSDVHFFRRGRICLSCQHKFLSAEAREDFLTELVELRDALVDIKRNAEQYLLDSQKTSKTLTTLNNSLSKLRALNVYGKQELTPKASPPKVIKKPVRLIRKIFDDF